MSTLANKVDFEVIISATDANPNGDPLSGNRPRINSKGLVRFQMSASSVRYATDFRIWAKEYSYRVMTSVMTDVTA